MDRKVVGPTVQYLRGYLSVDKDTKITAQDGQLLLEPITNNKSLVSPHLQLS